MTPTLKEDLDLPFLRSASRRIVQSSGLVLSEAPPEAGRIEFFATTRDQSRTVGVSCSVEENAFSIDELEKLIADGKSVECDSLMVISSAAFSPEEAEWAASHGITLVDRPRFLHTYEQLPEHTRREIEESADPGAASGVEASQTAPEEESEELPASEGNDVSESTHHQPAATDKSPGKKKRWIPLVIILGVLLVVLPVIGIVASIAIPAVVGLKNSAEAMIVPGPGGGVSHAGKSTSSPGKPTNVAPTRPGIDEKYPTPGISTKTTAKPTPARPTTPAKAATPAPSKTAAKPTAPAKTKTTTPVEPKPLVPEESPAPTKPAMSASPDSKKSTQEAKAMIPLDPVLAPGSHAWKVAGRKEVRQFLSDLWSFEKLRDDPFFDLSEAILDHNTVKQAPLDGGTEMALFVLPRKLEEYPVLACAALTILSPSDRSPMIGKLEPVIRKLDDPMLSLQFLVRKAESSQDPADLEAAFKALESALASNKEGLLPDQIAYFVLSEEFIPGLQKSDPERFLKTVRESSAVSGWLKDHFAVKD